MPDAFFPLLDRLMRRTAIVVAVVLLALFPASLRPAQATEVQGVYQLAAARESTPVRAVGEKFSTTDFYVRTRGGAVTISGTRDGRGEFWVDDMLDLSITRFDGTTVTRHFDDSAGCTSDTVLPSAPVNLGADLQNGINLVRVTFRDTCGGNSGNTAIYLTGAARCETVAPLPSLPKLDAGTFVIANYLSGSPAASIGCTTGFNLQSQVSGRRYSTFAKHCVNGKQGDGKDNSTIAAHQPMHVNTIDQRFGWASGLDCSPGAGKCLLPPADTKQNGDFVAWPVDRATPTNMVATKNGRLLPVLGTKRWQDVGNQQICHYGMGSAGKGAAERCGAALTEAEKFVTCLRAIDCSGGLVPEPMFGDDGDSGGPVYVYNARRTGVYAVGLELQAQGTQGTQGSLIIPIQTVLTRLGDGKPLVLVTAS